jgi:salicylate hydroxylase
MIPNPTASRPQIAIAGGGIAGLTLALLLAHQGIASCVYERTLSNSPAGNGLQLGPNINHLFENGLISSSALDALASHPEHIVFMDGMSGQQLNKLPLGRSAIERWGGPSRVIHRTDLQHLLLDATNQHTDFITLYRGYTVTSFTESVDHVTVHGTRHNGENVNTGCSLLIGADGVWSNIRMALLAPPPVGVNQTAWRALIPADHFPFSWARASTGLWLAPGMHLVHYPVKNGTFINAVVTTSSTTHNLYFIKSGSDSLQRIISAAPEWTSWPLFENTLCLGKSRIVLMGDAAHAMLPHLAQGAAQAMEDAASLAALIPHLHNDPKALLSAYAHSREPRLKKVMAASRRNGEIYQMSGIKAQIRNLVLRTLPPSMLMRKMDWLYYPSSGGENSR